MKNKELSYCDGRKSLRQITYQEWIDRKDTEKNYLKILINHEKEIQEKMQVDEKLSEIKYKKEK